MFDIVAKFPDKAWLDATAEKLNKKLQYAVKKSQEMISFPTLPVRTAISSAPISACGPTASGRP